LIGDIVFIDLHARLCWPKGPSL